MAVIRGVRFGEQASGWVISSFTDGAQQKKDTHGAGASP
jgi:hypothetical protein